MKDIGVQSRHYFVSLLKDCVNRKDLKRGRELHAEIVNTGLLSKDIFVGSALVSMYVKFAELAKAQETFDQLPIQNVVLWNALITGYTNQGYSEKVLYLVEKMQLDGVSPSFITFICSLKACASIDAIDKGCEMHAEIARRGLLLESSNLCSALVDLYVQCGFLERAQEVLSKCRGCSVDAWNAMICGYVRHMLGNQALHCLKQMQLERIHPDAITFSCSLKGCGSIRATEVGKELHAEIIKNGLLETDPILGSSLLDMYLKCGLLLEAEAVFDQLLVKDAVAWTTFIGGFVDHEQGSEALHLFSQMQHVGCSADSITFLYGLKACGCIGAAADGRQLHAEAEKRSFLQSDASVSYSVVDMYCKCGLFVEANKVFSSIPNQDVVLWNMLIGGYTDHEQSEQALYCFDHMQHEGVSPDAVTLACSLKACGNIGAIDTAREIHANAVCKGFLEGHLGNALVDMYGKCGSIQEADEVLKKLPSRDTVSWNALISGYAYCKHSEEAVDCFKRMQVEGVSPNLITFSAILKACNSNKAVEIGMDIHTELVARGLLLEDTELVLAGMIVELYAYSGFFQEAMNVFEKLPAYNSSVWNILLSAYADQGFGNEAVQLLDQMRLNSTHFDHVTLVCSVKAYGSVGAIEKGLDVHAEIERLGLFGSAGFELIDMYMKFSLLAMAQEVFDKLSARGIRCWNALIFGFVKHGCGEEALQCVQQMQLEGALPDVVTFTSILKACGSITAMEKGREMHAVIASQSYFNRDLVINNTLLDMYIKCEWLEEAHRLLEKFPLRNTVSWNVLIAGYAKLKHGEQALICFAQMKSEGLLPDTVSFTCILKACGSSEALSKGREIHADAVRKGLMHRDLSVGNAVIDMYARHGCLREAQKVFQKLPSRDIVSWNTLLTGFLICNQGDQALNYFKQMQLQGVSLDAIAFGCILKACSNNGALDTGQEIHAEIERGGLFSRNVNIINALISMYARCGLLCNALEVSNGCKERDLVSWNTLITGYALLGDSENAFHISKGMEEEGFKPDSASFLGILYACNHEGVTDRAETYFHIECCEQKVIPSIEHLTCVVDMLGRAGQLDRALLIVREIPFHPDIVMSCSLLGACRKWGIVELACQAFKHAVVCDEKDVAAHIFMFNIYADAEMEDQPLMYQ
ncbi:hypothetical protein GOP47_0002255 [Adiantum capillus-veneris]|uniref:Pentatricopeptide repeat-containing protein n=1 Tax=Adiantum capillus-veneris TaxID=13818 RepID=A0A9D4VBR8_ADICA|nr:hypothetical protein GOP47_0002255 [Adiantum capillus-veneris]